MTGGTVAATSIYLRTVTVLDEVNWIFKKGLANMNHSRDAHGLTSWRDRHLIVVGSWHHKDSSRTCEIYDIKRNKWFDLPLLHDATSAPGLVIIKDRYLYKIGGQTDIDVIEVLDLHKISMSKGNRKRPFSEVMSCTSGSSLGSSVEYHGLPKLQKKHKSQPAAMA